MYSVTHGLASGHIKLHLYMLFTQQMAAGVLELDLGNPEDLSSFSYSCYSGSCFTKLDPCIFLHLY